MIKIVFILLLISTIFSLKAQNPIDTIDSRDGQIVIYSNRTWQYLADQNFNGVMNQHLHELISSDSSLKFEQKWDNNMCFSSNRGNDMSRLKDTIWLCVLNESDEEFVMPVPGILTSKYGPRKGRNHNGVDLDLNTGDTVRACWSGKVRYAKFNNGGFGNLIVIRHHNGLESYYAHLSKLIVAPNQYVKAGDVIGLGGNTGRSFGSHLHFEIRFYDAAMNPEEIIDFSERKCKDHNLFVHRSLFKPGAKPTDQEEDEELVEVIEEKKAVVAQHKYYRVKAGDTLSEIAAKNRTTVSKICQLNGIRVNTSLQIGRSLRVK
ncbi:MAG: peptidoglycan DD-metalloendopeptidase family protein [Flavobacteriia bacterium]|nr:peptidoglycan DD-metalloendopeptidase family protein [Flavobacteriia bacterium]